MGKKNQRRALKIVVESSPASSASSALRAFAAPGLPRILFVTHAWGGGIEQHVATLAALLTPCARVMILRPGTSGGVELELPGHERFGVAGDDWPAFCDALKSLNFSRLHLHHVHGLPQAILDLDVALNVPLDCTLHDYFSACPQYQLVDPDGRYCGEPDGVRCNVCIKGRPHPWQLTIEQWRAAFATVLTRADRVFAPSASVAEKVKRYFPALKVRVLPHPQLPAAAPPAVVKVALLGALSNPKGLAVALKVAEHAQVVHSSLLLRLIGHAAEPLPATIVATGSYAPEDLPKLIAGERPDVIWLPSQVPETFSFTLTAAINSGVPIVASNIGALTERLREVPNATLLAFDAATREWHQALLAAALKPAGAQPVLADTTRSYVQTYTSGFDKVVDAASFAATAHLQQSDTALQVRESGSARPLINVFRIGIYGGHRPSTQLIERALEALPPGETDVVGRSQYDAASAELNRVQQITRTLQSSHADERIAQQTQVATLLERYAELQRSSHQQAHAQSLQATQTMQETLVAYAQERRALHQQYSQQIEAAQLAHVEERRGQQLAYAKMFEAAERAYAGERALREAQFAEAQQSRLTMQATRSAQADESAAQKVALDKAEHRALAAREYIAHLEQTIRQQQVLSTKLESTRIEMLSSTSWRLTRPLRWAVRLGSHGKRAVVSTLGLIPRLPVLLRRGIARYHRGGWKNVLDRVALEYRSEPSVAPIKLPDSTPKAVSALALPTTTDAPVVSVLVPVFGQHETTFACLKSIAEHPTRRPFEIIVMDDCSIEPAAVALASVGGIRVLRNEKNLGFIGNVNAAARHARGDWLVVLNNDTILRAGALDALLNTFDEHKNVGLVGAKLLNADGTIQEAGGIVWRDGSAWNWGRGSAIDDPRFNFVRDADYCSGAALAIRRELFAELGGFDPYYTPAYYEDTDLAFRIRARGLRVVYQPAAEIFHREGVSHGRNETTGIKAYQVRNGKKFFERWKETLAGHRENATEPELEAHRSSRSNILIVEACMLTPDQDAGSVRMTNLMRILIDDGHHVSFVADNLDGDPKYASMLTRIGVEVLFGHFAGSVRKVLKERGTSLDAIVFCRHYIASQHMDTVRTLAPQALILFDTVDLHFVREEREAVVLASAGMARSAAVTRSRELAVIAKCDVTIVVSETEKLLLAQVAPTARVDIVSLINAPINVAIPFEQRAGILFIGGFRHAPNVDAMKWYVNEVLPKLRTLLPDVVTTVVGSHMPDEVAALARDDVRILGFVEDTTQLLQRARVSIAPMRYGAGIKGKINEAMNNGIPVVATTCAIEGMQLEDGRDVLVADDAADFARAIARVYRDQALWQTLAAGGRANLEAHFSIEAARPAVRAAFTKSAVQAWLSSPQRKARAKAFQ